ncbi:MAG: EAL domain-containing protein [Microthrixaceae bacterium]|nr:EAL domain-containing protein [Microthrixaceae bacterium]
MSDPALQSPRAQLEPTEVGHTVERLTLELARMRDELDESMRLATHDALTGLPNRRTITERLDEAIERPGEEVAVMFIDMDRFKVVNDLYGHEVGDRLLRQMAEQLHEALGDTSEAGRLGGDEFVVVTRGVSGNRMVHLAQRVLEALSGPVDLGHRCLPLTVSIGVASSRGGMGANELLNRADAAMYRAKRSGRGSVVYFDEEMERELAERSELERELTAALQDGQLGVHYQPIIDMRTRLITGFEGLVRWMHPRRGVIPASRFVPLAEDVGEVWAIDAFVLGETGRRVAQWQRIAPEFSDLMMSVNLSAQQFRDNSVVETIDHAVAAAGVEPSTFQLEIAETTVIDHRGGDATGVLQRLRDLGVRLAMDNFGTGASSLAVLKALPLDVLNIDRRFIAGLGECRDDEVIVEAVLGLARAFGVEAVAEGVETPQQHEWLARAGCGFAQGFHYSRPLTAESAEALLRRQASRG